MPVSAVTVARWRRGRPVLAVFSLLLATGIAMGTAGCSSANPAGALRRSAAPDARPQTDVTAMLDADTFDPRRLGLAIFQETNRVRRELGLRPFRALDALDRAADLQASADALGQNASHQNVISTLATPYDRVRHVGLRPGSVAENAALMPLLDIDVSHGLVERRTDHAVALLDGQTLREVHPHTYASFAAAVLHQWMESPGHRANIVSPEFRYVGCSGRPTKMLNGLIMIATIQEFYVPASRP